MLRPAFIDHLVFRVSDLNKTETFYTTLLGPPLYQDGVSLMYKSGETRLFFTAATEELSGKYNKETVGLNHLAFGVRTLSQLTTVQAQLDILNIPHSGQQLDPYGMKDFLWLDDPDGMRIEFYLRSD